MTIKKVPDKNLRRKASRVSEVGDTEKRQLNDMAEAMYLSGGVGLAGVQVGINKQLAVIDIGTGLIKMANPIITKKVGLDCQEEGCLSVPDVIVKIKRAKKIEVNFLTEKNEVSQLMAEGLLARAIQHEIDHLSGKLIIDYISPLKRLFLKKRTKYNII